MCDAMSFLSTLVEVLDRIAWYWMGTTTPADVLLLSGAGHAVI
jgi:hypothetical protein